MAGENTSTDQGAAGAWYNGADAETVEYVTSRGLDKLQPKDAAFAAIKSHREAQKFLGAPPESLLRMPKDAADQAGWDNVFQRLGVPKEAKAYDFKEIKFKDGSELDDAFKSFMAERSLKNHLTPTQANQAAKDFVEFLENSETSEVGEKTAALAAQKDLLNKNWGASKDTNMVIARNAAAALKVTPEVIQALEDTMGYAAVMEMFRQVGTRMGEDKFVGGQKQDGRSLMTVQQAEVRKSELMKDRAWAAKYVAGDKDANKEMLALNAIITGDTASLPAGMRG